MEGRDFSMAAVFGVFLGHPVLGWILGPPDMGPGVFLFGHLPCIVFETFFEIPLPLSNSAREVQTVQTVHAGVLRG